MLQSITYCIYLHCKLCKLFKFLHCTYCLADASCDDAFQVGSTCYKIHKEKVRWFTAVNRCLSNNATLAVLDDNVHQYFPITLLSEGDSEWIGLVKSWWTWPGLEQLKLDYIKPLFI